MTDFEEKLLRFANKFEGLESQIDELAMQALEGKESQIEDLNLTQLAQGKDSQGKDIKPDYTEFTKSIKKAKGQPTNKVTLKDEGDFYQGIEYKIDFNKIDFTGKDPKTEELKEKYGDEILGLNEESEQELILLILEDLTDLARKYILT